MKRVLTVEIEEVGEDIRVLIVSHEELTLEETNAVVISLTEFLEEHAFDLPEQMH
jgi:hypothetical protein